jgi:hypothetical protein
MGGKVASDGWKHRFQSLETRLPMSGNKMKKPALNSRRQALVLL